MGIIMKERDKYMRKKFLALAVCCAVAFTGCSQQAGKKDDGKTDSKTENKVSDIVTVFDETAEGLEEGEAALVKSEANNPIAGGTIKTNDLVYTCDPSVLVDGDTVYLYAGHDEATDDEVEKKAYSIPEYLCYSTKDLKEWKEEGTVMLADIGEIGWASDSTSGWAAQVAKHYDKKAKKDKYYLYFCTWQYGTGKQSIGVAVAQKPTGPFKDIGKPLINGEITEPQNSNWDDIDPTVWIEEDENGEEHRYLGWGNSRFYSCELNEDMISVKDLNGDGKITYGSSAAKGDIIPRAVSNFTEAPWFYRRQDENGKYYGDYYLFHASGWYENMAYSTTNDIMNGKYKFGGTLMPPTATSNTNHMAVFDFQGKTYFIYHNGSLPGGNGYRRSACITELHFNDDGTIKEIPETATGLNGVVSSIYDASGAPLEHETFINSSSESEYPYTDIKVGTGLNAGKSDAKWVITDGKADASKASYVSIQSENKPGLYFTVNDNDTITLAQDTDATEETAKKQTFRTVKGLNDEKNVSFESVSSPGKYLAIKDGKLCVSDGADKKAATFAVQPMEESK